MPAELTVRAAGLSPVKGMRHLPLGAVHLDARGAVGDRAWCLVDVAARRVLRTVQHPVLMAVVARVEGDLLTLRLPDGRSVASAPGPTGETLSCDYWGRTVSLALTDGPHGALVSSYLGRDVRLARAPRTAVVFGGSPVTMVTTASLDDLAERVGGPVDSARFRPNLVVATDEPWVEDSWRGRELRVGDAVVRIEGPVPRCAVVDHHPATGEKDLRLLRALAASRPTTAAGEPAFGMYAQVSRAGDVRPG